MPTVYFKKVLVIGIMVLFLGASVVPVMSGTTHIVDRMSSSLEKAQTHSQKTHRQPAVNDKNNTTDYTSSLYQWNNKKIDSRLQINRDTIAKTEKKPKEEKHSQSRVIGEPKLLSYINETQGSKNDCSKQASPFACSLDKRNTLTSSIKSQSPQTNNGNNAKSIDTNNNGIQPIDYAVHNINTGKGFDTIQAAIDDEETSNGDLITVDPGTYNEAVDIYKEITLRANTSYPVINSGYYDGIYIEANNVTVDGFNITNSYTGIYCEAYSGFTLVNNIFWNDLFGIGYYVEESDLTVDYTIYDNVVKDNVFYMESAYEGVIYYISLDYNQGSSYTVTIGDLGITNNTFYMNYTAATAIVVGPVMNYYGPWGGLWVDDINDSSISVGTINISENSMYGGNGGVSFMGGFDGLNNVQLNVGDILINNNKVVGQNYFGILYFPYEAIDWHGNTQGVYGKILVQENTISSESSNSYGIGMFYGGFYYYYSGVIYNFDGTASLTVGDIRIQDNTIDEAGGGVIFYMSGVGGFYFADEGMYNHSSLTMGKFNLSGNTINSVGDSAIKINAGFCGTCLYNYSSVTIGSFQITDNTLSGSSEGITVDIGYLGYIMYNHSSFTMDDIEFMGNDIDVAGTGYYGSGIGIDYIGDFGENMYDDASFNMGDITVDNNDISTSIDSTAYGDAIYAYIEDFGINLNDNSVVTMGDITFNSNTINVYGSGGEGDGLYIEFIGYFGYEMANTSSFAMGDITMDSNHIDTTSSDSSNGIYAEYSDFGEEMHDIAVVHIGDITFNSNVIITSDMNGYGIYIWDFDWFGYDMYNSTVFSMGSLRFNHNVIHSYDRGITLGYSAEYDGYGWLGDFGTNMSSDARFSMGNIESNNNTITADDSYGIYIDYEDFGLGMGSYWYDNGVNMVLIYDANAHCNFTMGDITCNDNTITNCGNNGIYVYNIYDIGYEMYGSSSCTLGDIQFNNNNIGYYQAEITDNISDTVHIARGYIEGIYNSVTESYYSDRFSPENTEWSDVLDDPVADPTGLSYTDWRDAVYPPPSMVGKVVYMHIISEDRYFEMHFTYWQQEGGGGFSYTRYELVYNEGLDEWDVGDGVTFTRPSSEGRTGIDLTWIGNIGEVMGNISQCTMGSIEANNNTIAASDGEGIYIDYGYFGSFLGGYWCDTTIDYGNDWVFLYDTNAHCAFTMGNVICINNTITNNSNGGIYIDEVYDIGYKMYGSSTCTLGDIQFNNNNIGYYQAEITDNISDTVHIARGYYHGIYNSVTESFYSHHSSPENTEWSPILDDPITDPTVLSYTSWEDAVGNNPSGMVGKVIYMYIISEDRYFEMHFSSWQSQGGGGFSYTRYELVHNEGWEVGDGVTFTRPSSEGGSGIYIGFIRDIGENMYNNSQCTMGNLETNNNTIYAGDGSGIYIDYSKFGFDMGGYWYESYDSIVFIFDANAHCVFTMGDITCNYNNITNSGNEGIYTSDVDYLGVDMCGSSTFTMGNIQFNHNVITTTDDSGLYLSDPECYGNYMQNTSTFTMGNLEANYNTIKAGAGNGIYMYYDDFGYEMGYNYYWYDTGEGWDFVSGYDANAHCVFTMGNIACDYNNITNSRGDGIYVENFNYIGTYIGGSSTATIGNITFNNNDVYTNGNNGIGISDYYNEYDGMYYFGYELYDHAKFAMGSIQINDNMINSTWPGYGINISWLGEIGESLHGDSQATIGSIEINNNVLNDGWGDGIIYTLGVIGFDLHNNASVTVKQITMVYNNVISGDDGITDEWSGGIGTEIYDNAIYNGRGLILAYNTIDTAKDGIRILGGTDHLTVGANTILHSGQGIHMKQGSNNNTIVYNSINGSTNDCIYIQDDSHDNILLGNVINASQNKNGIRLDNSNHTMILRNTISNNSDTGINITSSSNNTIYHNNILYNTLQAFDNASNTWNDSYPSGGNYWSDYLGHDDFSGPNQDVPGSDGIGDTPYNITKPMFFNRDYYPFFQPIIINNPSLNTPSSPSPANGATGVSTTTDTSWTGGDPDNDYNNYDIYFGTTNPPAYYDTVYFVQGSPISYMPGTLTKDTTYYWKIVAWDAFGDTASGPVWSFYTGTQGGGVGGGAPPIDLSIPVAKPGGPYYGVVNTAVHFDGSASYDKDTSIARYDWQFASGDAWYNNSGATPTHTYTAVGTYTVTLRVFDFGGNSGTNTTTATITATAANQPPTLPTITGPTTGELNTLYTFSIVSTDPNGDTIQYQISWGDGDTDTSTPRASGTAYTVSHTWTTNDVYTIEVYAEDPSHATSDTATVTMAINVTSVQGDGYVIDTDGDGIPDTFYSNSTGLSTTMEKRADGKYLVDINGDGVWDHLYDPVTKTISAYSPVPPVPPSQNNNWMFLAIIIIAIVIVGLIVWLFKSGRI